MCAYLTFRIIDYICVYTLLYVFKTLIEYVDPRKVINHTDLIYNVLRLMLTFLTSLKIVKKTQKTLDKSVILNR